jgi:hypothetical protein
MPEANAGEGFGTAALAWVDAAIMLPYSGFSNKLPKTGRRRHIIAHRLMLGRAP